MGPPRQQSRRFAREPIVRGVSSPHREQAFGVDDWHGWRQGQMPPLPVSGLLHKAYFAIEARDDLRRVRERSSRRARQAVGNHATSQSVLRYAAPRCGVADRLSVGIHLGARDRKPLALGPRGPARRRRRAATSAVGGPLESSRPPVGRPCRPDARSPGGTGGTRAMIRRVPVGPIAHA